MFGIKQPRGGVFPCLRDLASRTDPGMRIHVRIMAASIAGEGIRTGKLSML
jgi:hypothetical protein